MPSLRCGAQKPVTRSCRSYQRAAAEEYVQLLLRQCLQRAGRQLGATTEQLEIPLSNPS